MHAKKDESHGEQVQILPMNDVPFVSRKRLVDKNIRQQTEGEYQNS